METKYVVRITSAEDTQNIVSGLNKNVESDVDVKVERHVCDAKSVLGFLSYDLSKPVALEIHSDSKEEIAKFLEVIKDYIVNN